MKGFDRNQALEQFSAGFPRPVVSETSGIGVLKKTIRTVQETGGSANTVRTGVLHGVVLRTL